MNPRAVLFGLLAAASFGISAPVAKRLLPETGPLMLAALLYLGGGVGLTLFRLLVRGSATRGREMPLGRRDLPALFGIIVLGGIAGPVLMLWGLTRLSGMAGALLLNLEGPLTVLIAVAFFADHLGLRGWISAAAIFSGAGVLGWSGGPFAGDALGVLAIAGACAAWAVDNNLTQRLTLKDPARVVQWKTLGAGSAMLAIALVRGDALPATSILLGALALGAISYGASILLDAYALRLLGAAREAAFFATAPFIGALASMPILGERPTWAHAVSAALMIPGVALLARERHSHVHSHEALVHEHMHVHDAHHTHSHEGEVSEPHSHPHTHEPITHEHPHSADAHHRHPHH